MSIAEVDIVNRALIKIGSKTIMSLGDDVKSARAANKVYPMVRDRALVAHPWNFAMKRRQSAPLTEAPAYGWDFAYAVPADCLRVWNTDGNHKFAVEGKQIVSNDPPPLLFRYIARIEDTSAYPPQFADYLASLIAAELSYYLASSADLAVKAQQEAEVMRPPSYLIDAQEGTPEAFPDGSWLAARH